MADPNFDRNENDIVISGLQREDFHDGRVVGARGEMGKTKNFGKGRRKRQKDAKRDKEMDELRQRIDRLEEQGQATPRLEISRGTRHRV